MNKIIKTDEAPTALGAYSQAVISANLIFTSGQLGINPKTGQLLDTVEEQTEQAMQNIDALLKSVGSNFNNAIKATIFLTNLEYFDSVNKIYKKFFTANIYPARSCVQVTKLPSGALVEIELIASI